ncbi:AGAP007224-PA [Anopheles gambiae str. PEST]|uniref:AGAP007224-PA n=1 Tax=Anopheles gambiae TaxID=7165 RepID=A7URK8_ANOGA|nr:AGAP007224-PA [Anopheles gambiae str. PEST]
MNTNTTRTIFSSFAFAFVLIALFAVFAISEALPQPEEAASNDGPSANARIVLELTPEEAAAVQAMGGRGFWGDLWNGIKKAITIGCDLIDCKNQQQQQQPPQQQQQQ